MRFRSLGNGDPTADIQSGLVPAGDFLPGIVVLAQHEIGRRDGTGMLLPGVIGHDPVRGAVRVSHLQLREEGRNLSPGLVGTVPDVAAVPAVAHQAGQGVVAGFDQRGDVVNLIANAFVIGGPVGSEDVVADALAVEVEFI